MNWEAIGAIGQAISALALIVVIVQVRHARTESRRALSEARLEAIRDINSRFADERMAKIFAKSMVALQATVTSPEVVYERS